MKRSELDTRDRILDSARREFLEKGYEDAWLRGIAKNAGVTTGALYGYFRNKEELFGALVEPSYREIQSLYEQMLREFATRSPKEFSCSIEEASIRGMHYLSDYMYDHRDEFKLILCCSEGTEYAGLVHEMARIDENATNSYRKRNAGAGVPVMKMHKRLEHIMTTGLFSMFFELIVHDIPHSEAGEYIDQLMNFFIAGYSKLMNS